MQKRVTVIFLSISILAQFKSSNAEPVVEKDIKIEIEEYIKPFVEMRDFSGCVLVAHKGQVLVNEAFGYSDFEQRVANTTETRFHIASLTKMFTGAAILELRNRGEIELSDPVSKFIPDYPSGEKIKIEHLLRHRAGIVNYGSLPDYGRLSKKRCSLEEVVGWFKDQPLEFEPGQGSNYSNSGYVLLALIIERITGKTWEAFLSESIFEPLEMKSTGNIHDKDGLDGIARGYDFSENAELIEPAEKFDLSHKVGAGSLYSTVGDLNRWHRAVRDGKYVLSNMRVESYGWGVRNWHGRTVLTQDGSSPGSAAHFSSYIINEDLCIVLLSNIKSGAVRKMRQDLAAIVLGQPYEEAEIIERVKLTESAIESCLGRYQYDDKTVVTILRDKSGISYQWKDLPYLQPLTPIGGSRFFARGVYDFIQFTKQDDGIVNQLHFGDRTCSRIN